MGSSIFTKIIYEIIKCVACTLYVSAYFGKVLEQLDIK